VEQNGRVALAGRVLGAAALTAQGVSIQWLTQAIGSKAVAWLGAAAPVVAAGLAFAVLSDFIIQETKTRELKHVLAGYDVFAGWRSVVALREIGLYRARYRPSGYWQSRPIWLSRPVRQIRIHAEQDVPSGTTVRYLLSHNGSDWQEVLPVSEGGTPIGLESPAQRVWLRVEMSTQVEYTSPAVYAVLLEGIP